MFNVINIETGEVINIFDDGATASRFVSERNQAFAGASMTVRYRIVRQNVVSDAWKAREQARFANGTYRTIPWYNEDWNKQEHYCHVSNDDDGKIAFTNTAEDGERDKQTRMNPGRYLSRYYGEVLSQDEIRAWCGRFDVENNKRALLFASDSDSIEQVYKSGPR